MRRFAFFVRITTTILTKSHKIGLRNGQHLKADPKQTLTYPSFLIIDSRPLTVWAHRGG
jgi:hypothetical protein